MQHPWDPWAFSAGMVFMLILLAFGVAILAGVGRREGKKVRRQPTRKIAVLLCPSCGQKNRVLWYRAVADRETRTLVCGKCRDRLVYQDVNPALDTNTDA